MKTSILAGVVFLILGLGLSACQGTLPEADAGRPPVQDAGSIGDAAVDFTYCNRDLPQNQTKFIAVMVSRTPDGGTCEIAYGVSFGQITFSCACGPVVDCQKIGASLAAEAAACLAGDAGLEAGQ